MSDKDKEMFWSAMYQAADPFAVKYLRDIAQEYLDNACRVSITLNHHPVHVNVGIALAIKIVTELTPRELSGVDLMTHVAKRSPRLWLTPLEKTAVLSAAFDAVIEARAASHRHAHDERFGKSSQEGQ